MQLEAIFPLFPPSYQCCDIFNLFYDRLLMDTEYVWTLYNGTVIDRIKLAGQLQEFKKIAQEREPLVVSTPLQANFVYDDSMFPPLEPSKASWSDAVGSDKEPSGSRDGDDREVGWSTTMTATSSYSTPSSPHSNGGLGLDSPDASMNMAVFRRLKTFLIESGGKITSGLIGKYYLKHPEDKAIIAAHGKFGQFLLLPEFNNEIVRKTELNEVLYVIDSGGHDHSSSPKSRKRKPHWAKEKGGGYKDSSKREVGVKLFCTHCKKKSHNVEDCRFLR